LKKIHDKDGKISISNLKGGEKMKINFNGNQKINIKYLKNNFHKKVIDLYKNELKNITTKVPTT